MDGASEAMRDIWSLQAPVRISATNRAIMLHNRLRTGFGFEEL